MPSSVISSIRGFTLFASLFVGTGFISGSIVHFGEGVTMWDGALLFTGVLLFVLSSCVKEYAQLQNSPLRSFVKFIMQSLLLALGIGMASGGTQHFIDTPAYSAVLIPIGLWIGFLAFLWKEQSLLRGTSLWLLPLLGIFSFILWVALVGLNKLIPESVRRGHGSHSVPVHVEGLNLLKENTAKGMETDHGH